MLLKLLVSRLNEALNNAKVNRDDELRSTLILTTGEIGRYGQSLFSLLVASLLFFFNIYIFFAQSCLCVLD